MKFSQHFPDSLLFNLSSKVVFAFPLVKMPDRWVCKDFQFNLHMILRIVSSYNNINNNLSPL